MQRLTKISIIAMAILVVLFGVLITLDCVKADDADSKKIADYEYQMNELRKQKEKCFDDLTWKETQEYLSWFTKPCVSWDEEIMRLREKADELKAKSYDGGLR